MLRAVIFDLDDTLLDHRSAAAEAVSGWAASLGVAHPDPVARWAELTDIHYPRYQRREIDFVGQRRARMRDFVARPLGDAEADDLFERYFDRYRAAWRPFPDALAAVRRARAAGLRAAVLTNGDADRQSEKVATIGLAPLLDHVVASSELTASKPDPRAFAETLQCIGARPDEALMVGDSLENDVHGALAAGLDAVLLDRDGRSDDPRIRRIRTLDELTFAP
ncbi:HAD family hydrolase [Microbacterium sp. gxy059]|uniref:HAD family hydrolase n=1 Tax=Microbacterium sp. gxy059 TaxID=2957199 RepID=UPI003D9622CB